MKFLEKCREDLRILIAVPVFTYIISYLYLAYYHKKFFIFSTIVHEGGIYTFLQTMFYASHFLGHVPVLVTLSFLFAGSYICLSKLDKKRPKIKILLIALILLLSFSFILSIYVFGIEDTSRFISQEKQGVNIYEEGGSWNLHLPSLVLLFFFVPVYIYLIKKIFNRAIYNNKDGFFYIFIALFLFLIFVFLFNSNPLANLTAIWKNPRYLAHSVRELLTFPLTYFPIPLYFFLKKEKIPDKKADEKGHSKYTMVLLSLIFLIGFSYQSYVSLSAGINNIAQKPAFTKENGLGIPYLLASHYFEHFLDTVFFALLCMLLYEIHIKYIRKELRN